MSNVIFLVAKESHNSQSTASSLTFQKLIQFHQTLSNFRFGVQHNSWQMNKIFVAKNCSMKIRILFSFYTQHSKL